MRLLLFVCCAKWKVSKSIGRPTEREGDENCVRNERVVVDDDGKRIRRRFFGTEAKTNDHREGKHVIIRAEQAREDPQKSIPIGTMVPYCTSR